VSELDLVKSPRPKLVNTIDALKRGDAAGARRSLTEYDLLWNGIEVYVSTRSRPLYLELEAEHQRKIEEMLAAANPDLAAIVPVAESMLAKYDEAIRNSETGPAISPLFDEVAAIRIARAGLRATVASLKGGDNAQANASFHDFQHEWPRVKGLIQRRSSGICQEIDDAIAKADDALHQGKPAPEVAPLVDAVMDRYNAGLGLVVTEARAATG